MGIACGASIPAEDEFAIWACLAKGSSVVVMPDCFIRSLAQAQEWAGNPGAFRDRH